MDKDYEELRDWMARADVQAAVARQSKAEEEEEPPQLEQLAMQLDMAGQGRAGA